MAEFRLMQPADLPALCELFQTAFGDPPAFAQFVFEQYAGPQNVFVAEQNGAPVSMASAIPVEYKGQQGAFLYGVATHPDCRRQGIAAGLLQYAQQQLQQRGAEFLVLIPQNGKPELFDWYARQGYQKAFALRRVSRPIRRNLWAQAEFDTTTAKLLRELRGRFCPDSVRLPADRLALVLTEMYKQGVTVVSTAEGYGLYFRQGDTLYFPELQAANDRAAELLLQAAREKESIAEQAVVTVGAEQELFCGEGVRQEYGMIKFLAEPFDVSATYLRLLLDE